LLTVVVLGARGSGKTVYLAALFERLRIQRPDVGFRADCPRPQHDLLHRRYRQISDPTAEWPEATATDTIQQFQFDCRTANSTPALTMRYLDYSGELLEPAWSPVDAASETLLQLEKDIGQASALLVLLDGDMIGRWMRGDDAGIEYVDDILPGLLDYAHRGTGPVHFVITKWDLLCPSDTDDNNRLAEVRDHLMQLTNFRDLIAASQNQQVVRLIPVSAVGPEFLHVDRSGVQRKRTDPRKRIEPVRVEVPLAAVLPDVTAQLLAALTAEEQRRLRRARNLAGLSAAGRKLPLDRIINTMIRAVARRRGRAGFDIPPYLVDVILDQLDRRAEQSGRSDGRRESLEHLVTRLRQVVADLEDRMPASVLSQVGPHHG
jgi:hypothetical protein